MSIETKSLAASALLWKCWQDGAAIEALPEPLRPKNREEGYAIQARVMGHTTKPLYGWKIAATSVAGQKHINVDGPLAGRIIAERVIAGGHDVKLGANRMRVAEPEFAFRMAETLTPQDAEYAEEDVKLAIGSMHPAIEIPDSRYCDFTKVGAAQLIADDACAHQFYLGPEVTADWRSANLAAHKVTGTIAGRRGRNFKHEGSGANVLGSPLVALTWIANELSRLGVGLHAGEVVSTGTCIVPLPLAEGDVAIADFGAFGRLSLQFH